MKFNSNDESFLPFVWGVVAGDVNLLYLECGFGSGVKRKILDYFTFSNSIRFS